MVSGVVLLVAYTYRDEASGEVIRLISARRQSRMKDGHMQKTKHTQADEIRALKRMKDRDIDTTDIPPAVDWSKAVTGKFYRPVKKPLTIRLDADVLLWLKGQGKGYQTRINALLRNSMEKAGSEKFVVRMSDHGDFAA
jgi:uncharacterized protein (DUF4415 family)